MSSRDNSKRHDRSDISRRTSRKGSNGESRRRNTSPDIYSSSKKSLRGDDRKASRTQSQLYGTNGIKRNSDLDAGLSQSSSARRRDDGKRRSSRYVSPPSESLVNMTRRDEPPHIARRDPLPLATSSPSHRRSSRHDDGSAITSKTSSSKRASGQDGVDGSVYRSSRAEEGLSGSEAAITALPDDSTNHAQPHTPHSYSMPQLPGRSHSYGEAADYYGDAGESVHHQPGVRTHTPILQAHEPHLMAASAEPAPPEETGHGAAAEFYTSLQDDPMVNANTSSMTHSQTAPPMTSTFTSAGARPPHHQEGSFSHLPAYAAGAAGVSAAALAHYQKHHARPPPSRPSTHASHIQGRLHEPPQRPPFHPESAKYTRSRGPFEKFADWWNDYEDVRKMEEYTEYIGVCRYCFDPRSFPSQAPRPHKPRKTRSQESLNHGRVDKERRYHVNNSEGQRRRNDVLAGSGLGGGLAGYGLSEVGRRESQSASDSDGRTLRRRNARFGSHTHGSDSSHSLARHRPSSKLGHGHAGLPNSDPSYPKVNSHRDSKGRLISDVARIEHGDNRVRPTKLASGRIQGHFKDSMTQRPSSSSSSDNVQAGFFSRLFSSSKKKSKHGRPARDSRLYNHANRSSSSSNLDLAYNQDESMPQRMKPDKSQKPSKDPAVSAQNALIGLGAATAALAAYNSRRPQADVHGPTTKPLGKRRTSPNNDGEWESVSSEDEHSVSSASSGLAFGGSGLGQTPAAYVSTESVSSTNSGIGEWGWRWGSKKRKQPKASPAAPSQKVSPTSIVQEPIHMVDDESLFNSPQSTRLSSNAPSHPLRESVPKPVLSPQVKTTAPMSDGPAVPGPIMRPVGSDVPIQHPQPKTPARSYTFPIASERASATAAAPQAPQPSSERDRKTETEGAPFSGQQSYADDVPGSSKNRPQTTNRTKTTQQHSPISNSPPQPDRSSKGNSIAFAGATAAIAAGALKLNRRRSSSSDSAEEARKYKQSRRKEDLISRSRSQSPADLACHKTVSSQAKIHDPPLVVSPPPSQRASEMVVDSSKRPESAARSESPRQVDLDRRDSVSHTTSRQTISTEPEFFEISEEDRSEQELQSPALHSIQDKRETESQPLVDFSAHEDVPPVPLSFKDEKRYNCPEYDAPGSPIDPRFSLLRGAPRLNIIAPTPPESEAGYARNVRSHSSSPIRHSTHVDDFETESNEDKHLNKEESLGDRVNVIHTPEVGHSESFEDTEPVLPDSARQDAYGEVSRRSNTQGSEDEAEAEAFVFREPGLSRPVSEIIDPTPSAGGYVLGEVQDYDNEPPKYTTRVVSPKRTTFNDSSEPLRQSQQHTGRGQEPQAGGKQVVDEAQDYDDEPPYLTTRAVSPKNTAFNDSSEPPEQPQSDVGPWHEPKAEERTTLKSDSQTIEHLDEMNSCQSGTQSGIVEENHIQLQSLENQPIKVLDRVEEKPPAFTNEDFTAATTGTDTATPTHEAPAVDLNLKRVYDEKEFEALPHDHQNERQIPGAFASNDEPSQESRPLFIKSSQADAESTYELHRPQEQRKPLNSEKKEEQLWQQSLPLESHHRKQQDEFEPSGNAVEQATSPDVESSPYNQNDLSYEVQTTSPPNHTPRWPKDEATHSLSNTRDGGESEPEEFDNSSVAAQPADEWAIIPEKKSKKAKKKKQFLARDQEDEPDRIKNVVNATTDDSHAIQGPQLTISEEPQNEVQRKSSKKSKKAKKQKDAQISTGSDASENKGVFDEQPETLQTSESEHRKTDGVEEFFTEAKMSSKQRKKLARRQKSLGQDASFEDWDTDEKNRREDSSYHGGMPPSNHHHDQRDSGRSSQDAEDKATGSISRSDPKEPEDALAVFTDTTPPSPRPRSSHDDSIVEQPRDDNSPPQEATLVSQSPRTPSATAIPLRFRCWPHSPTSSRDLSQQTPAVDSPPTNTPTRSRGSRPASTEFKNSDEFRPLYLLERNRKVPELDDSLPSLPSSHTTSENSSVKGSEDGYESALESYDEHVPRDENQRVASDSEKAHTDHEYLDSGQTTPRAGAGSPIKFAPSEISAPDNIVLSDNPGVDIERNDLCDIGILDQTLPGGFPAYETEGSFTYPHGNLVQNDNSNQSEILSANDELPSAAETIDKIDDSPRSPENPTKSKDMNYYYHSSKDEPRPIAEDPTPNEEFVIKSKAQKKKDKTSKKAKRNTQAQLSFSDHKPEPLPLSRDQSHDQAIEEAPHTALLVSDGSPRSAPLKVGDTALQSPLEIQNLASDDSNTLQPRKDSNQAIQSQTLDNNESQLDGIECEKSPSTRPKLRQDFDNSGPLPQSPCLDTMHEKQLLQDENSSSLEGAKGTGTLHCIMPDDGNLSAIASFVALPASNDEDLLHDYSDQDSRQYSHSIAPQYSSDSSFHNGVETITKPSCGSQDFRKVAEERLPPHSGLEKEFKAQAKSGSSEEPIHFHESIPDQISAQQSESTFLETGSRERETFKTPFLEQPQSSAAADIEPQDAAKKPKSEASSEDSIAWFNPLVTSGEKTDAKENKEANSREIGTLDPYHKEQDQRVQTGSSLSSPKASAIDEKTGTTGPLSFDWEATPNERLDGELECRGLHKAYSEAPASDGAEVPSKRKSVQFAETTEEITAFGEVRNNSINEGPEKSETAQVYAEHDQDLEPHFLKSEVRSTSLLGDEMPDVRTGTDRPRGLDEDNHVDTKPLEPDEEQQRALRNDESAHLSQNFLPAIEDTSSMAPPTAMEAAEWSSSNRKKGKKAKKDKKLKRTILDSSPPTHDDHHAEDIEGLRRSPVEDPVLRESNSSAPLSTEKPVALDPAITADATSDAKEDRLVDQPAFSNPASTVSKKKKKGKKKNVTNWSDFAEEPQAKSNDSKTDNDLANTKVAESIVDIEHSSKPLPSVSQDAGQYDTSPPSDVKSEGAILTRNPNLLEHDDETAPDGPEHGEQPAIQQTQHDEDLEAYEHLAHEQLAVSFQNRAIANALASAQEKANDVSHGRLHADESVVPQSTDTNLKSTYLREASRDDVGKHNSLKEAPEPKPNDPGINEDQQSNGPNFQADLQRGASKRHVSEHFGISFQNTAIANALATLSSELTYDSPVENSGEDLKPATNNEQDKREKQESDFERMPLVQSKSAIKKGKQAERSKKKSKVAFPEVDQVQAELPVVTPESDRSAAISIESQDQKASSIMPGTWEDDASFTAAQQLAYGNDSANDSLVPLEGHADVQITQQDECMSDVNRSSDERLETPNICQREPNLHKRNFSNPQETSYLNKEVVRDTSHDRPEGFNDGSESPWSLQPSKKQSKKEKRKNKKLRQAKTYEDSDRASKQALTEPHEEDLVPNEPQMPTSHSTTNDTREPLAQRPENQRSSIHPRAQDTSITASSAEQQLPQAPEDESTTEVLPFTQSSGKEFSQGTVGAGSHTLERSTFGSPVETAPFIPSTNGKQLSEDGSHQEKKIQSEKRLSPLSLNTAAEQTHSLKPAATVRPKKVLSDDTIEDGFEPTIAFSLKGAGFDPDVVMRDSGFDQPSKEQEPDWETESPRPTSKKAKKKAKKQQKAQEEAAASASTTQPAKEPVKVSDLTRANLGHSAKDPFLGDLDPTFEEVNLDFGEPADTMRVAESSRTQNQQKQPTEFHISNKEHSKSHSPQLSADPDAPTHGISSSGLISEQHPKAADQGHEEAPKNGHDDDFNRIVNAGLEEAGFDAGDTRVTRNEATEEHYESWTDNATREFGDLDDKHQACSPEKKPRTPSPTEAWRIARSPHHGSRFHSTEKAPRTPSPRLAWPTVESPIDCPHSSTSEMAPRTASPTLAGRDDKASVTDPRRDDVYFDTNDHKALHHDGNGRELASEKDKWSDSTRKKKKGRKLRAKHAAFANAAATAATAGAVQSLTRSEAGEDEKPSLARTADAQRGSKNAKNKEKGSRYLAFEDFEGSESEKVNDREKLLKSQELEFQGPQGTQLEATQRDVLFSSRLSYAAGETDQDPQRLSHSHRDSGIHVAELPQLLQDSPDHQVTRDSGYHDGSPIFPDQAEDLEACRSSPIEQTHGPEFVDAQNDVQDRATSARSIFGPEISDVPVSKVRSHDDLQSPSPVESTSKNRASHLFDSPPQQRSSSEEKRANIPNYQFHDKPFHFSEDSTDAQITRQLPDDRAQTKDRAYLPHGERLSLARDELGSIPEASREHSPSNDDRSNHGDDVMPSEMQTEHNAGGELTPQKLDRDHDQYKEPEIRSRDVSPSARSATAESEPLEKLQLPKWQSVSTLPPPSSSEVANTKRPYGRNISSESKGNELARSHSVLSDRSITPSGVSNRSGTPTMRRMDRSVSSDLRAANKRDASLAGEAKTDAGSTLSHASSTLDKSLPSTYQPLKGVGKDRRPDMSDGSGGGSGGGASSAFFVGVPNNIPLADARATANQTLQEGWGDARSSPRSPNRPPSVRRRQSTQILDLESRLERVLAENRSLQDARSRGGTDTEVTANIHEALQSRDLQLREKDVEVNTIKTSLQTLQGEVKRLSEHNGQLQSDKNGLASDSRYENLEAERSQAHKQWESASHQLQELQQRHVQLSDDMEDLVRQEIAAAVEGKNAEIRSLRVELDEAMDRIDALQGQIRSSRVDDNFLNMRDEDYFDSACQQLCQHVQQWVLRFSKFSDTRACRLSAAVRDEKIEERLDNAILDGSDVDEYLSDRVRRRDVFMSIVMTMIWEFVFTRYLFGMDREQRQKLKSLEKTLSEVGPPRAVAQWRATTLSLLSRREAFFDQRSQDTDAVVEEIYRTLERLLPPPGNLVKQIKDSLRNVMSLAVDLSIEMRTQRAEYVMLPPQLPEYDFNGDLAHKVIFSAKLMNERSGETVSNEELEQQATVVRIVLFPPVVKKGNDLGDVDDEVLVCPAQVLVARPSSKKARAVSGTMGTQHANKSLQSIAASTLPDPPV